MEDQASKKKAVAKSFYLRISPRKMRLVIDTIRHQPVHAAEAILMSLNRKAARMVQKVLKTAKANAKVLEMDENRLYVSDVRADGGPSFKRFMSRSMGRADRILKRTTHLSLVLSESDRLLRKVETPDAEAEKTQKGKTVTKKKGTKAKKAASGSAK